MSILSAMSILIQHPVLALSPALLCFGLYRVGRSRLALWVAAAWLLYFGYETGMKLRLLCSGECNIRIDLLLIYPALLIGSLAALIRTALASWRRR